MPQAVTVGLLLSATLPVNAQLVPDTTLPTNSTVTPLGSGTFEIGDGTAAGSNLFHSFESFSVGAGETVRFQLSGTIENILTRVTGNQASQIDGTLQVPTSANLFFLNPNGLSFGETAQLQLSGSFIGSTAQSLTFADGSAFSAVSPTTSPLLSISTPTGLQLGANASLIQVSGSGSNLVLDPFTSDILKANRPAGLAVPSGQTLALVGGPITVNGGNLTAPDGRVSLGSLASSGMVRLSPDTLGWNLSYNTGDRFSDITLSNAASVDVSGNNGGAIQVQGNTIGVFDGSTFLADTLGDGTGQSIDITASEEIQIAGFSFDPQTGPLFPSSILAEVVFGATGQGGEVNVETPSLQLLDGGQVSTATLGDGNSGNLSVQAQTINLVGGGPFSPSAIASNVGFDSTGQAGDMNIVAEQITAIDGGSIAAFAFGPGRGGTTSIETQSIELSGGSQFTGPSGILASSVLGEGGLLQITTDTLQVSGGAQIQASTFGPGNSGNIAIQANLVDLEGTSPGGFSSGIFAAAEANSFGNAGNVDLQTQQLQIRDGARITVSTSAIGNAGDLNVQAQTVVLDGVSNSGQDSGLFSSVDPDATGNGGNIQLNVQQLDVLAGARVVTATAGEGDAGNLIVNADAIRLSGSSDFGGSALLANAIINGGSGGDIEVNARDVTIENDALISASNFSSSGTLPQGQGPAGNILLRAENLNILDSGSITTASAGGEDGNIQIDAAFISLRRNARITADAFGSATGGNIAIATDFLIAPADENSDITANAENNLGGNIEIQAQRLFGIQPRAQLTGTSDITASSELGLNASGTITVNDLEIDPTQGVVELNDGLVDESNQIVAGCAEDSGFDAVASRFTQSGRGGLPQAATQPIGSTNLWQDSRGNSLAQNLGNEPAKRTHQRLKAPGLQEAEVSEASRWSKDSAGNVKLMAGQSPEPATHNCLNAVASASS